jgi:hypothetical protein
MNSDVIDAQYEPAPLANRETANATWTPSFAVAVDVAIERKNQKNRFFREVMVEGTHYGVIPGTSTKPVLLKGGAEMLLANMGLNPSLSDADPPTLDITGKEHGGEPYFRYRRICRIYRQTGPTESDRVLVAQAEGSCSSWETKYRYRDAALVCPQCAKPAIIKGKAEYGGGYVCFKKRNGCGAKFANNDPAITSQEIGKVANPDIADIENTILKMADKRALVAATLIATGCSDIFTQDVEEMDAVHAPAASTDEIASPREERSPSKQAAAAKPTPDEIRRALVNRARALAIIPPTGGHDELRAYCEDKGIRAVAAAIGEHLTALEAQGPATGQETAKNELWRMSDAQRSRLMALHADARQITPADRYAFYTRVCGRPIASAKELGKLDYETVTSALKSLRTHEVTA